MVNPKKDKPPHRGTRPKQSLQNTHKVYCNRCECSYNVPNNRNGDQWLNSHWRHFNCLQKKILRQQEEDASVVRRKRQPSQFTTHFLQRTLVLFCDSSFITNVTSETTSRIVLPSFSGIKYLSDGKIEIGLLLAIVMFSYKDPSKSRRSYRLRFQVAPLRIFIDFASYLPYVTMEHARHRNGVSIQWVEASAIVDGHFLVAVQGLKNSVSFDRLPPWQSYNQRGGTR